MRRKSVLQSAVLVYKKSVIIVLFFGAFSIGMGLWAKSNKTKPLKPNRLRYTTTQLEKILANKSSEAAIRQLFIDKDDLRSLGLADKKIQKIAKTMDSKRDDFIKRVLAYSKDAGGATHSLKKIDLGDAEYLRFLGAKEVFALKGVTFVFQKKDKQKIQSEIMIEIPAILLFRNKWKISEVTYIGKNLQR